MTTTTRPRHPVLRPFLVIVGAVVALAASGLLYSRTQWVWLGFADLVLLAVLVLAVLWLVAVIGFLTAGMIAGRRRR